ncbi:hypothetical protein PIIN_08464 [Serendipita indica DSM 11827]|uniref:Uncharacterized protein n=1 Tax=Serendipita indica (strain DSM 11827) TaxID=1109443 RepID=G4TT69_SERID|nr:hypothetical protein PIIN_08464 [Serendipita indica DSM 11827]
MDLTQSLEEARTATQAGPPPGAEPFDDSKFFDYQFHGPRDIHDYWKLIISGKKWELVFAHCIHRYTDIPDEALSRIENSFKELEQRLWSDAIQLARWYCQYSRRDEKENFIRTMVNGYQEIDQARSWVRRLDTCSFEEKVHCMLARHIHHPEKEVEQMINQLREASYQRTQSLFSEFHIDEDNHWALKTDEEFYEDGLDSDDMPVSNGLSSWDADERACVPNVL